MTRTEQDIQAESVQVPGPDEDVQCILINQESTREVSKRYMNKHH